MQAMSRRKKFRARPRNTRKKRKRERERESKKKTEAAGVDNTKQLIKGKLREQAGGVTKGRQQGRQGCQHTADRAANRDRNTINVGSCFQNESAAQKKPQHQQTPL